MSRSPFLLGLTGSIGMGKSTTAKIFQEFGVPVWDADAAVHRLYSQGGSAVDPVARLCPEALKDGAIDRTALKHWISRDPQALQQLEKIVHPLVAEDRAAFIAREARNGTPLIVLDIPLLFEGGGDAMMDATVTVTAPAEEQRARVLARPGMTEAQFETVLARQMPDAEKRARATYVIQTQSIEAARAQVQGILRDLREKLDA